MKPRPGLISIIGSIIGGGIGGFLAIMVFRYPNVSIANFIACHKMICIGGDEQEGVAMAVIALVFILGPLLWVPVYFSGRAGARLARKMWGEAPAPKGPAS